MNSSTTNEDYTFCSESPLELAYEKMLLLRKTEEYLVKLITEGQIQGPCHLGIGQEAISVAVAKCLGETDYVFASHRSHNSYLATTNDVRSLLAEIARKPSGCSGGYGGSTFLVNPQKRFWGSTSILTGSMALSLGSAFASKFYGSKNISVIFLGDGSSEEGVFHEALNFASTFELPIFFVCENNRYSCNVPIEKRQPNRDILEVAKAHSVCAAYGDGNNYSEILKQINDLMDICRSERKPVFLEAKTFRQIGHTGSSYSKDIGVFRNEEERLFWQNNDPIKNLSNQINKEFGGQFSETIHYLEKKIDDFLIRTWNLVKEAPSFKTGSLEGGRVYSNSSMNSRINTKNNNLGHGNSHDFTYLEGLKEGVSSVFKMNENIALIGQGLSSPWDSGKWVKDIYEEYADKKIFESPVAEAITTGVGVGAAIVGLRTIINHPRMDFMILASDQIVNHAAKIHFMSGGQLQVPLVIRTHLYRGGGQGAQQSQALYSWFSHIPGLRVVMPATPSDARDLFVASVSSNDPVLFIDDQWLYDWTLPAKPAKYLELKNQGPEVLCYGNDVTLVGIGYSTHLCILAAEDLSEKGVFCEVIDLRILSPLNLDIIFESVKKTGKVVIVDNAWGACGITSEILAQIFENINPSKIKATPRRVTLPEYPAPASLFQEKEYYIDKDRVVNEVKELLSGQSI